MNYEKKYKKALEKARAINNGKDVDIKAGTTVCEYIFPELAESEDEKIRKEIISSIKELRIIATSRDRDKAIAWLEKHGEQKSADKAKPKFKVHDWIVFNGLVLYIKEVVKGYYRTLSRGGIPNSYNWDIDKLARLWTVQDVMDGDVLIVGDEDDTGIAICGKNDKLGNNILYCYCDDENGFAINTPIASECLLHPATKEQSDLLFTKMREAGYVWDIEKKEIRKIKQKSDSFCQENCKGFQETGKCFADGECKAKKEAEQKPAWSEEDNNILNGITAYLSCTACNIEGFDRWYDWLKSLKSRVKPQWKPTDKQIYVLWRHCSEDSLLLSLYYDLKKLKDDKV